ncbi:MAG: hypothetical protein IE936_12420, partial [Moraxella osloensis]|nr:hypothetical protein [Moraxella osloensis]
HPFDAQFVLPEGWSLTLDQSSVKQHFRAWLRLFVMPEFWIADQNVWAVYNGLKKLHFTQQHLINSLQNAHSLADIQMELVNFSHNIQQLYQLSREDMDYYWVSLGQLVKDLNAWFPRAHFDLVLPNQNVYIFIQIKIFQLFMMNLLKYGHEFNETAQLPVSIQMTGDRMEILLSSEYWKQPMDDFLTSDKANAILLRQWIGFLQMSEDDHGDFQRLTFYLPLPTSSGNHD